MKGLEAELMDAARKLESRASELRARADRLAGDHRSDYKVLGCELRADRKRKLDALHDEHQKSVVGDVLTLAGSTPLALCRDCSERFNPRRLARRHRCVVAGCSSRDNNCGCGVTPCRRCNAPVCAAHAAQHEATCEVEARDRCGYTEDEDYLQTGAFCGKKMESGKGSEWNPQGLSWHSCFYCSTVTCGSCHEKCDNCNAVWCNACLKRNADVGEACCWDCSFHTDRWV